MYMLTAVGETAKLTATRIKQILQLKDDIEQQMKNALGASYSYDLVQLMFQQPYLKIELLERNELAHRQTASAWLKKMADASIVMPERKGRTTYYINYRLMKILSGH